MQIKIKIFAIFLLIILNAFHNSVLCSENKTVIEKENPEKEIIEELTHIKQQIFLDKLKEFAIQYKTSPNAIKKFLLREKRSIFIKKHLNDRLFEEWIGRIKKIQTTENGEASLAIELSTIPPKNSENFSLDNEFNITLGTFKSSNKDLEYKTLILSDSPLYNRLANFKEGEWIIFSGNFLLGDKDYLKIANTTENKAMLTPQFIVKFEFFEKINLNESNLKVNGKSSFTKIKKDGNNLRSNNLTNTKTISIRYYQNYRLSNYNWDYHKFINRWHNLVRYHWNNHPPSDYLTFNYPKGGEVFVLVAVKRDGNVSKYLVNSTGQVSEIMKNSALEAVRAVPLPSLPNDFPDEELKVEFRFALSRISHIRNKVTDKTKNNFKDVDNKSNNSVLSKMEKKLLKKQLKSAAKEHYNEGLKHELSSHFHPNYRFDPNLELQIELTIGKSGRLIQQKITSPIKSEKFQLAVMNSLRESRFAPLPKSLVSNTPYRVRLIVIP